MSFDINQWIRETPSLAGRRNPAGVPMPIALAAAVISLPIFVFGGKIFGGGPAGHVTALVVAILAGVSIILPASRMVRKDRDWFALAAEYVQMRFFYIKVRLWGFRWYR